MRNFLIVTQEVYQTCGCFLVCIKNVKRYNESYKLVLSQTKNRNLLRKPQKNSVLLSYTQSEILNFGRLSGDKMLLAAAAVGSQTKIESRIFTVRTWFSKAYNI